MTDQTLAPAVQQPSSKAGFSLLEILVATSILAVVFAYTSGAVIQGGYFQAKAPLLSQASLLVNGVVLDLEEEYRADGFPSNDLTNRRCELPGDFDEQFQCNYDLEKLDMDQAQLAEMANKVIENMMAGSGEDGNLLGAIPMLSFLTMGQLLPGPISPSCPANVSEFIDACGINVELIQQNIFGVGFVFPQIVMTAIERIRKLRVRIVAPAMDEELPVLEIETFIISVPEEMKALQTDFEEL